MYLQLLQEATANQLLKREEVPKINSSECSTGYGEESDHFGCLQSFPEFLQEPVSNLMVTRQQLYSKLFI
jgi:hypothetical protein